MAKKPAPKKTPAKKPVVTKKPSGKSKQPAKKAVPSNPKPAPAKKAVSAKAKPMAPAKAAEPKPAMKPVFTPVAAPSPALAPAARPVMKNGTGGATALTISAQAAAGNAANGNSHPANIMVLVSCAGWPVTDLTKDHFTLMEYFEVPGQQAPFSNNITSFRNVGTGAYLLQVKPINGAPWRSGHHIAQILVSSADDRQGQVGVKLIIR
jgi:hypothetical protein